MVAFALATTAPLFWLHGRLTDPSVAFLIPEGGAQWIRFDRPFKYGFQDLGLNTRGFRTRFEVPKNQGRNTLTLRAFRHAKVYVDDALIFEDSRPPSEWKHLRLIELPEDLSAGKHTLTVVASHKDGPVLVIAYCEELSIGTGPAWEASADLKTWTPAATADKRYSSKLARTFERGDRALWSMIPQLLPLFLIVTLWRICVIRGKMPKWLRSVTPGARGIRWILLVVWIVMAMHNFSAAPKDQWAHGAECCFGYDVLGQMEYIYIISDEGRLPSPGEGWKTSEPPLFYALIALPYSFVREHVPIQDMLHYLRILALMCGLAQIELSYRVLREVYPDRPTYQALGTVVVTFLPLNLYFSQYLNNLSFAAAISSLLILMSFHFLRRPSRGRVLAYAAGMGVVLGFGLLTKVTAILLIPPLVLLMFYASFYQQERSGGIFARRFAPIAMTLGVAGLIAGWFYVKNLLEIGTPFALGNERALGMVWSQDPGFHSLADFTRFGVSLVYPVYSQMISYWDSIYSTFWTDGFLSNSVQPYFAPWDYTAIVALPLLGLVPMAAIVWGVVHTLARYVQSIRDGRLFALLYVATLFAAMIFLYITTPVYSAGKAMYLLNVIPAIAVLAAGGYGAFSKWKPADAVFCGLLACWAYTSYSAFWMSKFGITMIY